jgi:hypothetical protein
VDTLGAGGACENTAGNAGTECRPSAGDCDVAETCTGDATECPADGFEPMDTACRAAAGECDLVEVCSGSSAACPADEIAPDRTECRPAVGDCDVAEVCDGVALACPDDALAPATTECRASTGACDPAEVCDGTTPECPVDVVASSGLYTATGGDTMSDLYRLDPTTGAVTSIGPTGGYALTGLAVHPTTDVLYGVTTPNSPTSPESLVTLSVTTGAATLVGEMSNTVADITFASDGRLFGWSESTDDLVRIDIATGAVTLVGEFGVFTRGSGIAFASDGRLFYAGDDADGLLRILDPATGLQVSTVGTMTGLAQPVNALAFNAAGSLFGLMNPTDGMTPTMLIRIDATTAAVTNVGPGLVRMDALAFGRCP